MRRIPRSALPVAALLAWTCPVAAQDRTGADRYRGLRHAMVVEQIAAEGVTDTATLRAMRTVPRHEFVPVNLRERAYGDYPLPIGLGQTISQPYIVGFMTELLEVDRSHRVLEIGRASCRERVWTVV